MSATVALSNQWLNQKGGGPGSLRLKELHSLSGVGANRRRPAHQPHQGRFIDMTNSKFWGRLVAVAAVLLLVGGGAAFAQLQTGNLYGKVVDEQGSALPGVTVTLSGEGAPAVQVTDAQGAFRFPGLSPASYKLKAELEGFSTI